MTTHFLPQVFYEPKPTRDGARGPFLGPPGPLVLGVHYQHTGRGAGPTPRAAARGASVLLHMATQQPARVEAMVLAGAELYYTQQARTIYRDLHADSPGWDWAALRRQHVYGDDQIRALLNQFPVFADDYEDMHFTPPHLATISAATLIVQGDRDE